MNFRFLSPQSGILAASGLLLAVAVGSLPVTSPAGAAPAKKAAAKGLAKAAPKPATAPVPTEIPLPGAALGAPPASLARETQFADASLVVDFSSDWQGYLEPCG